MSGYRGGWYEAVELRGRNRGSCRGSECGSRRRTSKWRAAMVNMRLQSRISLVCTDPPVRLVSKLDDAREGLVARF